MANDDEVEGSDWEDEDENEDEDEYVDDDYDGLEHEFLGYSDGDGVEPEHLDSDPDSEDIPGSEVPGAGEDSESGNR